MVSRVFNKSRVGNVGKLVLVFSVFVAQLLPLPQATHAADATSSIYMIPKSDPNYVSNGYNPPALLETKVNFEVKAGEPVMLFWQAFLNPKTVLTEPKNRLSDETCDLTSSTGEAVNYLNSSSIYGSSPTNRGSVYFPPLDSALLMLISSTSTNLVLKCRFHSVLSDGTLKVSKYLLTGNPVDSLPKNSSIDIKAGEIKVLTFQGKAGKQLTFKLDSSKTSSCSVTSISELSNWKNNFFLWDDGSFPVGSFGGIDLRGSKVATATKLFTPTANGTYLMVCKIYDGFSGTVRFLQKDNSLKLLRPQAITNESTSPAIETETTSPAKCPVAKAPSEEPKISINKFGLFIEYKEAGFAEVPGCIDGFRLYASTLNPYKNEKTGEYDVSEENGSYPTSVKDCEKLNIAKGSIACLISFEKDWLRKLSSQNASSKTLAVNASAKNLYGESIFSQRVFLFEKESALISLACISMQTSFSNNMIFRTPIAYIVGVGVGLTAGAIVSVATGGIATPFVVAAGTSIVAASVSKPLSERVYASIDKKAAKKFVETYPVTALELLISMKKSANPDVRAKSDIIQKAIQASDLMKIYQPLIGENNYLTSDEVAKILTDEKLSRIQEQEVSKFEKNGAKDVKTLFAKNPKIKVNLTKGVSKVSQGVDVYMSISEQNQNNQSAVELVLPNNCNF